MKKHRVAQAPSRDENPAPHQFIEFEPDRWHEVGNTLDVDHAAIHNFIDQHKTGPKPIALATRYLNLFLPDWQIIGTIDESE